MTAEGYEIAKSNTRRALELFAGTKCVGKVLEEQGYEVISLDFMKKFNPTICVDICEWDYTIYPPDYFDVIWASPECRTFSIASGGKHRLKNDIMGFNNDALEGNRMIDAMLKILDYYKPKRWYVENPRGLLQYYPPMKVLGEPLLTWYGNYDWTSPKPTHIWSNVELWEKEKRPVMSNDLYFIRGGKRVYKAYDSGTHRSRSMIPHKLIEKLLSFSNLKTE